MKPDLILTTPETLQQIAVLQQERTELSSRLVEERKVFTRIIQEQATGHEKLEAENIQLRRWLEAEQERAIDKDRRIASLEQANEQLRHQVEELQSKAEDGLKKEYQLKELQTVLFGQRSERFVPQDVAVQQAIQQTFGGDFDTAELEIILEQTASSANSTDPAQAILRGSRKHKRHQARKGRRGIPTHMETETIVFDYPGDKTGLKPMGKKVSTYYDFIPGKLIRKLEEHLQYQFPDGKIVCTPVLPRMVERGTVSNRLLAHLQTERFVYFLPYYRQLKRLERSTGVVFAASTIDHWEEVCYKKLKRLLKVLKKAIQQAGYIKADETTLKYLHDVGTGKASNGWLWVFLAPEIKLILFEFHPGRSQDVPREILKDFKGTLQTDALASYTAAFKDNEDVTLMGCLAHIRRGFKKGLQQNRELAGEAMTYFSLLYKIEGHAEKNRMDDNQRLALRKKYSRPILDRLEVWLREQKDAHVPGTPLAKAITYALNQWGRLQAFMENGQIDPDNNSVERAIRPITLFRKNSLFASNEHGGERAALFYSLVESCKLNGIDPFEYLHDVYNRLHDSPANELIHLLPNNWKPAATSAV